MSDGLASVIIEIEMCCLMMFLSLAVYITDMLLKYNCSLKECFKKCFDRDLDDDIKKHIIAAIKKDPILKKFKYTAKDIITQNGSPTVAVEINAYDSILRKKFTSYYYLEYTYAANKKAFLVDSCYSGDPIPTDRSGIKKSWRALISDIFRKKD